MSPCSPGPVQRGRHSDFPSSFRLTRLSARCPTAPGCCKRSGSWRRSKAFNDREKRSGLRKVIPNSSEKANDSIETDVLDEFGAEKNMCRSRGCIMLYCIGSSRVTGCLVGCCRGPPFGRYLHLEGMTRAERCGRILRRCMAETCAVIAASFCLKPFLFDFF